MSAKKQKLKVISLGGLGEIGKNITIFEYGNEIIIVDCGIAFPEDDLLGIDLVIPDFTYLIQNKSKVKAIILTHGHEDHIGSIPYLFRELNVPIYATKLTLGLLKNRLKEHNLVEKTEMICIEPDKIIKLGHFKIDAIRTNHSLADSIAIIINTPVGNILHSGDFKIDYSPIQGEPIDLQKFAEIGKKGVLLFLCESTNADQPGHTISETKIGKIIDGIFDESVGQRIMVATFSSNIHRIQEVIHSTEKSNRKLVVMGRSMVNAVETSIELGYLQVKEKVLIEISEMKNYKDDKIVILTTGSQGEPMAVLSRIANGNHRQIEVKPNDKIIISASPIPGNEKSVSNVINKLIEKGADVVYGAIKDIHVSGHAKQEEIKILHALVKPQYLMPIHGEYRHLISHKNLAMGMGMSEKNIFIMDIGDVLQLDRNSAEIDGKVPSGRVFVDGLGVGDVGNIVLSDRKHMSGDGLIIIIIMLDTSKNAIENNPDIISRGFVYVRESEALMTESKKMLGDVLRKININGKGDWGKIKSQTKDVLRKFLWERTKRNPMIIPIIVQISE